MGGPYKRSCDSTSGGGDPLLDESAGDESDIDETTNEGEDKCCDLTTGGGDPLSDENANDESDIDETTNEGEDKCCDSTSGRSDPLFDEKQMMKVTLMKPQMKERDNLWKHKKNCFMASESTMKDKRHQSTSALLLPFSQEVSQSFKDTVFASMTYDSISFAARHDHIIVQYGERMFAKLGHERHQVGYISQKMRELARLLLKIKETKPDVKSLYDCISPKQFDTVLEAVRNLAGLDPQTGKYKTPSLALKLGHSLQTCALIVKAECIKSEDPVKEDQADKFSKLAVIEWAHKVGTGARTTLEERKWNKPNMLPLSEDIRQLHAKLSEVIEEKQKLLALSDDVTAWYALAEAT
ncbi:hypothetical protein BSL78_06060 [Apostichopus japonicus]|uniref:Uncharacterized protein n=1 Tax=Stichopus japonicus TaxID=307972 RepID=A0A2G8L9S4_STIJA|nr:hypothetical protein BSL78_06060 [Apostichopus japonicus]